MQSERAYIRGKLAENNLSQVWLRSELEDSGIVTDKTVLAATIRGDRNGKKSQKILTASVKILEEYEQFFKKRSKN